MTTKVQLVSNIVGNVSGGASFTGIVTAAGGFSGNVTGTASTASFATTSFGLSGSPNITVGNITSSNINSSGIITATTFSGNITGTAATFTGNVSIAGTLTYEDVTNVDSVGLVTARTGVKVTAGGVDITAGGLNVTAGISTFNSTIDIEGAVETVSVGSTYNISTGRIILECDALNGTVFTHDLAASTNVGIVSLRNFPVTKNSVTTFTIIFTQNSTGTANTTAATGIGTFITLTPSGVSGFTTSARVATASTVTLSTTANDIDIVTLAVHYNGSGTGTPGNYKVFATNNSGYRLGSIRP